MKLGHLVRNSPPLGLRQPQDKDCVMKTERRWMKTLLTEAAACKTRMPWERGLRREALIARRAEPVAVRPQLKRATA